MKLNKTDDKVVATLQAESKELTLQEIADKTGETSKKIFKSLKKLFENEIVSTQARKYKLMITDTKAIKAKLAAKGERKLWKSINPQNHLLIYPCFLLKACEVAFVCSVVTPLPYNKSCFVVLRWLIPPYIKRKIGAFIGCPLLSLPTAFYVRLGRPSRPL